jgi:hypothetical protein
VGHDPRCRGPRAVPALASPHQFRRPFEALIRRIKRVLAKREKE